MRTDILPKSTRRGFLCTLVTLLLGLVLSTTDASDAPASTALQGGPYSIDSNTIDGGGGGSSGGTYVLTGTIGQFDADPLQPSSGGSYALTGGFWPGLAFSSAQPDLIFANGFE